MKKKAIIVVILCVLFAVGLCVLFAKNSYNTKSVNNTDETNITEIDTEETNITEIGTEADSEVIQEAEIPDSAEVENGEYTVRIAVSDATPVVGEKVTFTIDLPETALYQGVRVWETLNYSCIYDDWDGDKNATTQIIFENTFDAEGTYPIAATIGDNETTHNILSIIVKKEDQSETAKSEATTVSTENVIYSVQLEAAFFNGLENAWVHSEDSVSNENSLVQQYLTSSDYSEGKASVSDEYSAKVLNSEYRTDAPAVLAFHFPNNQKMVTLSISADKNFQKIDYQNRVPGSDGVVYAVNLVPQQLYYYTIVDDESNELESGSFYLDGNVRMLLVEGIYNVRDLGGWVTQSGKTVKYNMLFRGGEMNGINDIHISDNGIITMRDQLKILSEVDLRAAEELEDPDSDSSELGEGISYFRRSIVAYNIWDYGSVYYTVLHQIMNEVIAEKPVYFHCYGGADRTGTIAFLLNGVLGVCENDLDRDYELTTMNARRSKDDEDYVNMLNYIKGRSGKTLQEKFVSYFKEIGFQQEEIDQFIDTMLE